MQTAPHRPSRLAVHFLLWTAVFLCLATGARAQYLADGIAAVVNDNVSPETCIVKQSAPFSITVRQTPLQAIEAPMSIPAVS